jgi:tetratricopeptide (TPR) repeat protein
MTRQRTRGGLAAVLGVCVALGSGCGTPEVPGSESAPQASDESPDQRPLRPVTLPDLARPAESVRAQLHVRYSSLQAKIKDPGVAKADLARAYGETGQLFMAADYLEGAEACYLNATALAPDEPRWPYYLGHLYRNRDELARSVTFFERTLRLRPADVPTLVWLGEVYLVQGRPDDAETVFLKALSFAPKSAAAVFGLGRAALARRSYGTAVEHLEQALALDRPASIIHYPLALAYRGLGDLKRAEAHLQRRGDIAVGRSDPLLQELEGVLHSAVAYESQGIATLNRGEFAAAAALFRKAVVLAPDNVAVRHRLGTALFLSSDRPAALEQFHEVLRRSPQFAKAHYSLGVILASDGRHAEAMERFSAAVKFDTNYLEARLVLADALRQQGRLQDSLFQYERILAIDPRLADARFGYAMTLIRLKRYRDARERLAEAMKLHPNEIVFAHAFARLLAGAEDERVRDGRAAMAVVQRLAAEKGGLELGITMAMTLAELGQYEEAVAWQRDALAAAQRLGRSELVPRLTENLKLYERRQPWRSDDSVEFGFFPTPGSL